MSKRFEISWVKYDNQRPEYSNLSNYLYLERYQTTPSWHTVINGGLIVFNTNTPAAGSFNQVNLVAFSNWHTSNSSNLYVNNITNRYFYTFDGGLNSITDGGSDMYDGGNYISF